MPKNDKVEQPDHIREVWALVLLGAGILFSLSLLTYSPSDLSFYETNPTSYNWAGTFGAYLGGFVFSSMGLAGYILPPVLLMLAFFFFRRGDYTLRSKLLWCGLLVLSLICLVQIAPESWVESAVKSKRLTSSGGVIGKVLADQMIVKAFGVIGSAIIFTISLMVSLIMLTGVRPSVLAREAWETWKIQREARAELSRMNSSIEDRLAEKEKELEAKSRELEERANVLKKAKPQAKSEPRIIDTSIPSPATQDSPKAKPVKKPITEAEEEEDEPEVEPANAKSAEKKAASGSRPEPKITEYLPPKPKPGQKDKQSNAPILPVKYDNYELPSLSFLQPAEYPNANTRHVSSEAELKANAELLVSTLGQFDVEVHMGDITKGPTITRYELHPAPGVKVERITNLQNNIALALKAERINILAPIPGKGTVGIEVPNSTKSKVVMRDLMESEEWVSAKSRIPLALGKDVYGHAIIADLAEMPHLLIAGTTGSGKSVCINSILASLLYRFSPEDMRLILIDPKQVELQVFNSLPHLIVPVVTDPKKVILALRWVVNEMEKRYQIFAKVGVRNIAGFNNRPKNPPPEVPKDTKKEGEPPAEPAETEPEEQAPSPISVPRDDDLVIPEKMSYIVVIIDELADLMLTAPADVEMAIARITQMARASGIHMVVATQRPSVDVITGVIKSNIPARIAFQVAAKVDSRTILDAGGADKLLGKGDMLYLPPGSAKLIRAQGVLILDEEIRQIVDFVSKQGKASFEVSIHEKLSKTTSDEEEEVSDADEELVEKCIEVIRQTQRASVSILQRRLRIGYTRAARIMDILEQRGIVGPGKGAEPRDILMDLDGGGPSDDSDEQTA